jgi:D-alanyl-D-alanine endopeptidase (penicillin-binding protein 7)
VAAFEADVQAAARDVAPRAEFLWNDAVTQPSTFGFWRPIVLLPRRMVDLSSDIQRAVLLHETWHVARHDWLWLVAEELVQTVFWFHPAIWWTVDQIQLAREQAVDALVVSAIGSRRAYLKAIVAFADVLPPAAFASAFLRRRHLRRRVEAIATPQRDSLRRSLAVSTALIVLTGASAIEASRLLPLRQAGAEAQEYAPGNGVTLPVVVKEVRPHYTPQALAARIEGTVLMTCVVATNGEPERIRVTRSVDATLGLDDSAVAALREWRFKPGTRQRQPVRVRVDVEMTFTLK